MHDELIEDRPTLLISGLDSLYVSYYLDTATGQLDWEDLTYQREKLHDTRNDKFAEVDLGSERIALMPFGKNPYRFVIANKFMEVRFGERIRPNFHVQFLSEGLWRYGVGGLLDRFAAWCASMGFTEFRPNAVARADWAFDYHLPVIDFAPENLVTRASTDSQWRKHGALQTLQAGKGNVVTRIYDKVAEI